MNMHVLCIPSVIEEHSFRGPKTTVAAVVSAL
jgi:hypothetical protein